MKILKKSQKDLKKINEELERNKKALFFGKMAFEIENNNWIQFTTNGGCLSSE